jgi:hypothetical protein
VALFRSPTLDYPPPAAETADGRVIGVDGMRPEDKLRTSPGVGLGGLTPAASPASFDRRPRWPSPELHERVIDPICGVLGVRAAVWRRRCREQMIEQSL